MALRRTTYGALPEPVAGFFDPRFSREWIRRLGPPGKHDPLVLAEAMLEAEPSFYWERLNAPGARGPLKMQHAKDEIDLDRLGHGWYLLPWDVEPEVLKFKRGTARGVLVVEKWSTACHFGPLNFARRAQLVIVCADGVPRYNTRRFLHRLTRELHLPIYLLTDNDPWGYFILSVLRRGAILPHAACAATRVDGVRYLGFRAGDYELLPVTNPRSLVLPWRRAVASQLRCLRKYRCFSSPCWREELDRFEKQRVRLELEAVTGPVGAEWLVDLLMTRIANADWLL